MVFIEQAIFYFEVIEVDSESMIGICICYCYYSVALTGRNLLHFLFLFYWTIGSCDMIKYIYFREVCYSDCLLLCCCDRCAPSRPQLHNVSMDWSCLSILKLSPHRGFLSFCQLVVLMRQNNRQIVNFLTAFLSV